MPSDAELRDRLEARAGAVAPPDLVAAARIAARAPRRRRVGDPGTLLSLLSAAAAIAVAVGLAASVIVRNDPAASHLPTSATSSGATAAGSSATASTPNAPPVQRWPGIVWIAGETTAFAFRGNTFVQDVIADGRDFMAVGYTLEGDAVSGRVWRSITPLTWEEVGGGQFEGAQLERIFQLGDGFLALGFDRGPDTSEVSGARRPAVWWSADGSEWHERTSPDVGNVGLFDAAVGPAGVLIWASDTVGRRLAVVGDGDRTWRTTLMTWTDDVTILSTEAGGPGFFATGATGHGSATTMAAEGTSGAIWTSVDGATWTQATVRDPGGQIFAIQPIADGWVAIGSDAGLRCRGCLGGPIGRDVSIAAWFSSDGVTWDRTGSPESAERGINVSFAGDGNRLLLFESMPNGGVTIRETIDGRSWVDLPSGLQAGDEPDWSALSDLRLPTVGTGGVLAFGVGPNSPDATSTSFRPWFGAPTTFPDGVTISGPGRFEPGLTEPICPIGTSCPP